MKKILTIIVLILLAVVMVFTCPGEQQHHTAMTPVMARVASQMAQEKTTGLTKALKAVGLGNEEKTQKGYDKLGEKMAPALVHMIEVHDYLFLSIGKLTYEGTTYPVSFGLFGHVFSLPLDKITKYMSEAEKKEAEKAKE